MLLFRVFYRLVQWLRIVTTPIDDNQVCEFAEESNPETAAKTALVFRRTDRQGFGGAELMFFATADRHDVSSTFPPLPSPCRP